MKAVTVQHVASPASVMSANATRHSEPSIPDGENRLPPTRQSRRPSPGLAARLKALGFGRNNNSQTSPASSPHGERIGRIPEDQIRQIDHIHQTNSTTTVIQRRGRAWSAASGKLTPQVTGGEFDDAAGGIAPNTTGDGGNSAGGFTPPRGRLTRPQEPMLSYNDAGSIMCSRSTEGGVETHTYVMPAYINDSGTNPSTELSTAADERDLSKPASDEVQSYFNPFGLQRTNSVYTLSRVSFAEQLAQLTSLQLPDAGYLSSRVSAISTSQSATSVLTEAAEQIRRWIFKASEVLGGLDADDDVEWAAAAGREGLDEVDNATGRFQQLISVYVGAIEELQRRDDISNVPSDALQKVVKQVEIILNEWAKIRQTLKHMKGQVEVAMEWEELWDTVLGDIGNEIDILSRLVFEMEERRHRTLMAEASHDGVDIGELETIVEETPPPPSRFHANNRFSLPAAFPLSPSQKSPTVPTMAQDDQSLLALFARMQPLRASLDFLPMRLSTFHMRAEQIFPTACDELESKRLGLEASWKHLERDAETLRRELGEDRWVLVFRGAGRQAQKMCESVDRSLIKLREAMDANTYVMGPGVMAKKVESYEAKKTHYGPAIERVLAIIEKGIKDRLTVNGEILRLHSDMQSKWDGLKQEMNDIDVGLDVLQAGSQHQELRDSISSMVSNDRSTLASRGGTPGSSPASSVVMGAAQGGPDPTTPRHYSKSRSTSSSGLTRPSGRRLSSMPVPIASSQALKKTPTSRLSSYGFSNGRASPPPPYRSNVAPSTANKWTHPTQSSSKPRWNSSVIVQPKDVFLVSPLPPAGESKIPPHGPPLTHVTRCHSSNTSPYESKIPLRSPLGRDTASSPITPSHRNASGSRLAFLDRVASPSPSSSPAPPVSALRPPLITSTSKRSSLQPSHMTMRGTSCTSGTSLSRPTLEARPASSMATARRTSLLPQPQTRGRQSSVGIGRDSPADTGGSLSVMRTRRDDSQGSVISRDGKPRWH